METFFVISIATILIGAYFAYKTLKQKPARDSVLIIVLGDFDHSPRIKLHSKSLAEQGWKVNVMAYSKSATHPIAKAAKLGPRNYVFHALIRIFKQFFNIVWVLFWIPLPEYVLIQNPPAIPILAIIQVYRWLFNVKLVIDWHNFGYSIMALSRRGWIISFAKQYEQVFGRYATAHLCVSKSMRAMLIQEWMVQGPVACLYDKPPAAFRRLTMNEQHEFFSRMEFAKSTKPHANMFTKTAAEYNKDRPLLIVSSTSWTEDEDFDIFIDALDQYEAYTQQQLPKLIVLITGKGARRLSYVDLVAKRAYIKITVHMPWLETLDYPRLLGSADLGVCLHTSSSGVDLPMKVVDMFGCGLPVCAVRYQSIGELVEEGVNGHIFDDARGLGELIIRFGTDPRTFGDRLRHGVEAFRRTSWKANWDMHARPIFQKPEARL